MNQSEEIIELKKLIEPLLGRSCSEHEFDVITLFLKNESELLELFINLLQSAYTHGFNSNQDNSTTGAITNVNYKDIQKGIMDVLNK